jgi:glycosyltransferase involved in cell wall biosynthesis
MGGVPELVMDGETGFLFEPNNAQQLSNCVRTLLGDYDLRKKFGQRARRIAETEYSLERHGAALLSLYQRLTSSSKSINKVGS